MGTPVLVHTSGSHQCALQTQWHDLPHAARSGQPPLLQRSLRFTIRSYTKMFIFSVRRHSKRLLKLSVPK